GVVRLGLAPARDPPGRDPATDDDREREEVEGRAVDVEGGGDRLPAQKGHHGDDEADRGTGEDGVAVEPRPHGHRRAPKRLASAPSSLRTTAVASSYMAGSSDQRPATSMVSTTKPRRVSASRAATSLRCWNQCSTSSGSRRVAAEHSRSTTRGTLSTVASSPS